MAKPLVDDAIDQDPHLPPRGFGAVVPCRAAAVAPDPHLDGGDHPPPPGADRLALTQIGSPWRKLNPSEQALLVLAYLRTGETFAELAAGFGIGTATAWRYVSETVALQAARSPKLRKAPGQGPQGRARLCGDRWHANPHRPGRPRPAVLLR